MKLALDKIFNLYSLIAINIAIILLALSVGDGKYFFQSGLIHIIAILFIILAVSRTFGHYYTYDPVLEKFFHATLVALSVFAASHVVEFFSIEVFNEYRDAAFAEVTNFYLVSLLSIIIGAEFFLKIRHSWSKLLQKISGVAIVLILAFSAALLVNDRLVSLAPENPAPYIYASLVFITGLVAIVEVSKIKRLTSIAEGFVNYLSPGLVLIVLAAIPNIFYELIVDVLGVAEYKVVYVSHFAFYAALSLLFLAFGKLSVSGGVYEELKKTETKGN